MGSVTGGMGEAGGADTADTAGTAPPGSPQVSLHDLRVVVERIEGRSVCGMRVGDWFELTESSHLRTCPGRFFCVYALAAALPLLAAKQRELSPGDWLEHDSLVACPDPDERLIMRIERTGRSEVVLGDVT
ncbi:MAG TPA: TIGR04076 family protein [Streptosporangiaceae bacterium]|nr:TIGR04076 family protein [Streptosporangiaceae bacterium]